MAEKSSIEWTDATWSPITGCSIVSPGCRRCYAMKLAGTRLRNHPSRSGLTRDTASGPVWTGEVRFNEGWLLQPLSWRRPRRIFVCAHSDLFHPDVPEEWIDKIFAAMALAPQHTFQILTKRPDRMRHYQMQETAPGRQFAHIGRMAHRTQDCKAAFDLLGKPFPHVWCGTSIERQPEAELRMPDLCATPAAVRFVSVEPLLAEITMRVEWLQALDWMIVGGESAADAKPMHPDWARSLRDQCNQYAVPFLFKQWGSWASVSEVEGHGKHFSFPDGATVRNVGKGVAGRLLDGHEYNGMPGET